MSVFKKFMKQQPYLATVVSSGIITILVFNEIGTLIETLIKSPVNSGIAFLVTLVITLLFFNWVLRGK